MKMLNMPTALTVENGAKADLVGIFYESVEVTCYNCSAHIGGSGCQFCGGTGTYTISVPVSWTTIKEIYGAAVELFSLEKEEDQDVVDDFDK